MGKPQTEEEFDALMDAISTVYGLRAGHTLTQDDVDAISLYDANSRANEEGLTDTFHRGYQDGLRHAGGADVQTLSNRLDEKVSELGAERALRAHERRWGFREGAQHMREMLARFVEQGGDAVTANSIRLNWNPTWGPDPGAPEAHDDSPAFAGDKA